MAERAPGWQSGGLASGPSSGHAASLFRAIVSSCVTQALVSSPNFTRGLRRGSNPRGGKGLGEVMKVTWGYVGH